MNDPKVSVVVPVYNGERFLSTALESVLGQSYRNWELVILDNHSTDGTAKIVQDFCLRDSRVHSFANEQTVDVISNHNLAVQRMALDSLYCKILHADDWLERDALASMVEIAESNPRVGMVGAWSQWGDKVMSKVSPYSQSVFTGSDIVRLALLGETYPFLSPSCLLIRNTVLRERPEFYVAKQLHADVDAAYEILKNCDFGVAQQVLVHIGRHEESVTSSAAMPMNTLLASNIQLLADYGPGVLSQSELANRFRERLARYYLVLARSALEGRSREFWQLHRKSLAAAGHPFSRVRLWVRIVLLALSQPRGALYRLKHRRRSRFLQT